MPQVHAEHVCRGAQLGARISDDLGQFKDVLASNGVTAFASEGTAFDPELHEAIEIGRDSRKSRKGQF